jgi:hypothetical protein
MFVHDGPEKWAARVVFAVLVRASISVSPFAFHGCWFFVNTKRKVISPLYSVTCLELRRFAPRPSLKNPAIPHRGEVVMRYEQKLLQRLVTVFKRAFFSPLVILFI